MTKRSEESRYIVLDVETTGFSPKSGDKIIEIGAVEVINRIPTGNNYHVYVNPNRDIPEGSIKVHGLTLEAVLRASEGKLFSQYADDFLNYIGNSTLVIHNAPFDVGFLDHELSNAGKRIITGNNPVFDTLKQANHMFPRSRNNLDALAKRFNVTGHNRELHGALVDSQILAEIYLGMTREQSELYLNKENKQSPGTVEVKKLHGHRYNIPIANFEV